MRCVLHALHAGSSVSSLAPLPSASLAKSRARTPNGRVNMGRLVCPIAAPHTTGNPKKFSMRCATSLTLSVPAGPSHSGNSPRTTADTPRNFPACLRCISARSTCHGFMPRSSRTRMDPCVSSSQAVPKVVSIRVRQPPSSVPSTFPGTNVSVPCKSITHPCRVSEMAFVKLSRSYPSGAPSPLSNPEATIGP